MPPAYRCGRHGTRATHYALRKREPAARHWAGGGHGVQTLPEPTATPFRSLHVASSRTTEPLLFVQSAATSQASAGSLLHTPAATASPGVASLQVPSSYLQQRKAPSFPHV